MNSTSTPVEHRKTRYDLNFKRSAVELWQSSGKAAKAVATELGISDQILKVWKQQLCLPPPPSTAQTMTELQAENRRLRRAAALGADVDLSDDTAYLVES